MNYYFIFTIITIGLSGIVAQVLLLRELLVSFYGNELTLGIILANWVIAEAIGAFLLGKYSDKVKNKFNIFFIFQIIFSLALPLSIYFCRTFKNFLGIPFGEVVGLEAILFISFAIIFPLGFCHGGLFSLLCRLYSQCTNKLAPAIGKIYTWETIGTILGGIILTYLFIPHFTSFWIVFIISLANLIICLFFMKSAANIFKYVAWGLVLIFLYFGLTGTVDKIQEFSLHRQWQKQQVLGYQNSIYGNLTVTKTKEQFNFFYNGLPLISMPYPDITFVQEFGNLPLLFHPQPQDILIISGGAGGLINEILKHPIKRIDYAELDPLIIDMLQKYPSGLTLKEFGDRRVNIINQDGRFFVRNITKQYDIVLIGILHPSDLSTNRLFTQEFFSLVKNRLKKSGIIAFCLPGSLTYLSPALKDLNACILNGLKAIYKFVRILPGDYNMYLASDSEDILKVSPNLIIQRKDSQGIQADLLLPDYLDYRLNNRWQKWFSESMAGATSKINQDLRPFAVLQMLIFWNKQFSHFIPNILEALKKLNLMALSILIFILTLGLFYIFYRRPNLAKLGITYSIATSGFFGMMSTLLLSFSFQVFYGYLYHRIGLLISLFMAGVALGSLFITRAIENIKNPLSLFIKFETLMLVFSYFLGLVIINLAGYPYNLTLIFIILFFISGFLLGLEFPLASKIYLLDKEKVGEAVGVLYFADLCGGYIAGILGGIVFLPILGLLNTCVVIVLFKLSSILLLVYSYRGHLAD